MIVLTAVLVAATWLAYSGPHAVARPGLLPLLVLVAVLATLFARLLRGSASEAGAKYAGLAGAAWLGLYPANSAIIVDPSQTPIIWITAAIALSALPLDEFPEWRKFGLFLAPLTAAIIWSGPSVWALAPWSAARGAGVLLPAVAAAVVALLASRWRHARPLVLGLSWFAPASLLLPTETLPAFLGIALAGAWIVARAIDLLPSAERQLLAAGCAALLLFYAAEISERGAAVFAAPARAASPPASATAEQLLNQSRELFTQGNFADSAAAAQAAIQLKPDYAEAYNNLGASLAAMKMWNAAIAVERRALELKPDFPLARNNLNWAMQQRDAATQQRDGAALAGAPAAPSTGGR